MMNLREAGAESKKKLLEFKNLRGRKGVCVDYDETLFSLRKAPEISSSDAVDLVVGLAGAGIIPLVATGRGVTMERVFMLQFKESERKRKKTGLNVYIAGADGRSLAKFIDGKKIETLYEHVLSDDQVKTAINAFQAARALKIFGSPDAGAVNTFLEFLGCKWDAVLLSPKYLEKSVRFKGGVFIEPTKFSIAGPENLEIYPKIISFINEEVKNAGLQVGWSGRDRFIHVRNSFNEDGKLEALKRFAKKEKLMLENIATFGDAPEGNDIGILTGAGVSYGFTNAVDFLPNHRTGEPPYILTHEVSPIHAVHEAIKEICTKN